MAQTRELINHYDVLGVSRNADAKEIKRAFREKSRSEHPDVSEYEDAEERFHAIRLAYETLSDDQERELFDELLKKQEEGDGTEWDLEDILTTMRRTGEHVPHADTPLRGEDVEVAIGYRWEDVALHKMKSITFQTKTGCGECYGKGYKPRDIRRHACTKCDGSGRQQGMKRSPFGYEQFQTCAHCKGTGHHAPTACQNCNGDGFWWKHNDLSFRMPDDPAQPFLLQGYGDNGTHGAPNGDVHVRFDHDPSDVFAMKEDELLHVHVKIDFAKGMKGGTAVVPTPAGMTVKVPVPEKMPDHYQVFVQNCGAPSKYGNDPLVVTFSKHEPQVDAEAWEKFLDFL